MKKKTLKREKKKQMNSLDYNITNNMKEMVGEDSNSYIDQFKKNSHDRL